MDGSVAVGTPIARCPRTDPSVRVFSARVHEIIRVLSVRLHEIIHFGGYRQSWPVSSA